MSLKSREWYNRKWVECFEDLDTCKNLPLYHVVWGLITARNKTPNISDLGCGDGNFCLFVDQQGGNAIGFDFSQTAVDRAIEKGAWVYQLDITASGLDYPNTRIYTLLEVLEHIEDDLFVLNQLKGKEVCLSVPSFDSEAHVRWFYNMDDVMDRYANPDHTENNLFDEIYGTATLSFPTNNRIFILYGRLK